MYCGNQLKLNFWSRHKKWCVYCNNMIDFRDIKGLKWACRANFFVSCGLGVIAHRLLETYLNLPCWVIVIAITILAIVIGTVDKIIICYLYNKVLRKKE